MARKCTNQQGLRLVKQTVNFNQDQLDWQKYVSEKWLCCHSCSG